MFGRKKRDGRVPYVIPHRNVFHIILMTISLAGVTFAFSLQTALLTPFLRELGLPSWCVTFVWLAGPISGLIVQPSLGIISDRCPLRFGRRRPFMILGAVFVVVAEQLISNCRDIGLLFGDDTDGHNPVAIVIAICSFWILDLANNAIQGPIRALLGDWAPRSQQHVGSAIFSYWVGGGQVAGAALGSVDWADHFAWVETHACKTSCANLRVSYLIGSTVVIITMTITVFVTWEVPLSRLPKKSEKKPRESALRAFKRIILNQQGWFATVNAINFFAWFGWFTFFIYGTDWMGEKVYGGVPADPCRAHDHKCHLYETGVSRGTLGQSLEAGVGSLISIFLPFVTRLVGTRLTYSLGNISLGILLGLMLVVRNHALGLTLFALLGFPFAVTQTLPYTIISQLAPHSDMGSYMGVRNIFVVLAQLLVSLSMALLLPQLFDGDVSFVLFCGGCSALISGIIVWTLRPGMGHVKSKKKHDADEMKENDIQHGCINDDDDVYCDVDADLELVDDDDDIDDAQETDRLLTEQQRNIQKGSFV